MNDFESQNRYDSANGPQPIGALIAAFIEDYKAEVVHPNKVDKQRFRAKRTVAAARHGLHVLRTLMERDQISVVRLSPDYLGSQWLPEASVYMPSGMPNASCHPLELQKRGSAVNSFFRWLIGRGYPVEHVRLLPLTLTQAAGLKDVEDDMSPDQSQVPEQPVYAQNGAAFSAYPTSPGAPPAPPTVVPVPMVQMQPTLPALPVGPPPAPMMVQQAPQQLPQQAPQQAPGRPATPPRPAPPERNREQEGERARQQLLSQFFPDNTERVRVWRHKVEVTGSTPVFLNDYDAALIVDEQGIEPFLLKHCVRPAIVAQPGTKSAELLFDVQAYDKSGRALSKRLQFTIGVPAQLQRELDQAAAPAPAPAAPAGGLPPNIRPFLMQGRRYYLGADNVPVPLDAEPPAPAPAPPRPAESLADSIAGALQQALSPIVSRLGDMEMRMSSRGGHGLGGLDVDPFGPPPTPPTPPKSAVSELVEVVKAVDSLRGPTAPAVPVTAPLEQLGQFLGMFQQMMQLASPRQFNVDTGPIEDRLKTLDAKVERVMTGTVKADKLDEFAKTANTLQSIFGLKPFATPQAVTSVPRGLAEVIGDVLLKTIDKLPETVEAVERLTDKVAQVRGQEIARRGVQMEQDARARIAQERRATRRPVAPQAPTSALPQKPAPAAPPSPKPVAQKYVVTPDSPGYRAPGMGNQIDDKLHELIQTTLVEPQRDLRVAALVQFFGAASQNPELVPLISTLETLVKQARFGRIVEILTDFMQQMGYQNVTSGYALGLAQDFVAFGVKEKMIPELHAAEFLRLSADSYEARAEEDRKTRTARQSRVAEDQQAPEEGEEEEGGEEEAGEEAGEGDVVPVGGEITIVAGGNDDSEEDGEDGEDGEEEDEEDGEEPEQPEPDDVPEEELPPPGAEPEVEEPEQPDAPEAAGTDQIEDAKPEEVPEPVEPKKPRKRRKQVQQH